MASDWTTPPTPEEMKADPWAAPPSPQEMAPQGFFARAMSREVPTSLQNQPPGTFDLLQRGMDWMGQKQGENLARVEKEKGPRAANAMRLFSGMLGMGALGGAGVVGDRSMLPTRPPPEPASAPVASSAAPAQTGGSVLREALGWATHPKLKAAQKVLDLFLKKEAPPPAPPTSYPSIEAPPSSWSSTYGPQPTPPSLPSTPGAEPIAPPPQAPAPVAAPPPASTAIGQADLAPSTLQRMQAVMGKPPPAGNAFEGVARANKVSELVKAIDANAGAHLGADLRDPRAAAALAEMPAQWWEGMAKAARINKPSQQTINQAIEFFKTRSAQGALPKTG